MGRRHRYFRPDQSGARSGRSDAGRRGIALRPDPLPDWRRRRGVEHDRALPPPWSNRPTGGGAEHPLPLLDLDGGLDPALYAVLRAEVAVRRSRLALDSGRPVLSGGRLQHSRELRLHPCSGDGRPGRGPRQHPVAMRLIGGRLPCADLRAGPCALSQKGRRRLGGCPRAVERGAADLPWLCGRRRRLCGGRPDDGVAGGRGAGGASDRQRAGGPRLHDPDGHGGRGVDPHRSGCGRWWRRAIAPDPESVVCAGDSVANPRRRGLRRLWANDG